MSTRSTTHFTYGDKKKPIAIVYRHSDGYPEGAGRDIHKFLDEVGKLGDTRFTDPSYLAAKYVVYLADMFNVGYDYATGKEVRKESKLDFLSVGIVQQDPGDIEYRYVIDCSRLENGHPVVKCYERKGEWDKPEWGLTDIPLSEKEVS